MYFAAFYPNDGNARTQALQHIYAALYQGTDLSTTPLTIPAVRTVPFWPDAKTLVQLPLQTQCEWFDYRDGKLSTIRLLVIDVDVIVEAVQEPEAKPETPSS